MKNKKVFLAVWLGIAVVFLIGSLLTMPDGGKAETIQETMRDAVLHESNQISFFGLRTVNPALISGMVVTAVLLIAATCIRIFVIPKFRYVPGRFQMLLEQAVGMFDGWPNRTARGGTASWELTSLPPRPTSFLGRCLSCSASR